MNYIAVRFTLILTLLFSLSGCFDISEPSKLNSSWETTASTPGNAEQFGFIADVKDSCPDLLVNKNSDNNVQQLPAEFNVADWNIYKQKNDNWRAELSNLIESNDLVILQEVKLSFLFNQLMEQYQLNWTQVEAFSIYQLPIGVLTASEVAPLSACKQTLTEPWIRFPKSSLITYFAWQGSEQPLLVANMHMINFTLGVAEFNQQLDSVISVIRQHDGPVIMAGDFNTWTNKRLDNLAVLAESAELEKIVYQQDLRETTLGYPLDDIYFRGLQQLSATSYATKASDHNPIVARFGPLY